MLYSLRCILCLLRLTYVGMHREGHSNMNDSELAQEMRNLTTTYTNLITSLQERIQSDKGMIAELKRNHYHMSRIAGYRLNAIEEPDRQGLCIEAIRKIVKRAMLGDAKQDMSQAMIDAQCFTLSWLSKRVINQHAFKLSGIGGTKQLRDMIKLMIEHGLLKELTHNESEIAFQTKAHMMQVVNLALPVPDNTDSQVDESDSMADDSPTPAPDPWPTG